MPNSSSHEWTERMKLLEENYDNLSSTCTLILDKLNLHQETVQLELWLMQKKLTDLKEDATQKEDKLGQFTKIIEEQRIASSKDLLERNELITRLRTLDDLESKYSHVEFRKQIEELKQQITLKDHVLFTLKKEVNELKSPELRLQQPKDSLDDLESQDRPLVVQEQLERLTQQIETGDLQLTTLKNEVDELKTSGFHFQKLEDSFEKDSPLGVQEQIDNLTQQITSKDQLLLRLKTDVDDLKTLQYRLQDDEEQFKDEDNQTDDEDKDILSREEFEHHYLPPDTYSYFAVADYFRNWTPTPIFLMTLLIFIIQVLSIGMFALNVTDFTNPSDFISVPGGVNFSVRISQFLALLISCWNQDEIRASINVLAIGYDKGRLRSIYASVTRHKWYCSAIIRLLLGFLSLIITFCLIVQSLTVRDVMLDFAAVTFVSELDNGVFLLAHWGYMGKDFQLLTVKIKNTPIYQRSSSDKKSKRLKKIPRLVSLLVIITIVLGCWGYVTHKQAKGTYVDQTVFAQFGDDFSPAIGGFSGLYELELENTNGMQLTYVAVGNKNARFSYCMRKSMWVFMYDEDLGRVDHCQHLARSSKTPFFDITKTYDQTWYVRDENLGLEFPLQHFFVAGQNDYYGKPCQINADCGDRLHCKKDTSGKHAKNCVCKDRLFGVNCEFLEPCQSLEISPLDENGFFGTRSWSRKYSSLKKDGENSPIQVYGKPIFIGEESTDGIFDVMLFTGRRWILTESKLFGEYNKTMTDGIARHLADFLANNFHAYWSKYAFYFASEAVDVGTPTDSATPVGLSWFRLKTSGVSLISDREIWQDKIDIEAKLFCAACNNETNPCFFGATCTSDGTCDCNTGSSGTLCQVPPDGNGRCDVFFNTPEFAYDGGDCCKETCQSTRENTCGVGLIENSAAVLAKGYIGYNNCQEPKYSKNLSGSRTLFEIIERGTVRCGSSFKKGFVELADGVYSGLEADLCKAVAAAVLGNSEAIEIVEAINGGGRRFIDLLEGESDILMKRVTHNAARDIYQIEAGSGFSFVPTPVFFDGLRYGGIPPFGKCADNLDFESSECIDLKICVPEDTSWMRVTEKLFPEFVIVATESTTGSISGLSEGFCNAIGGEVTFITEFQVRSQGFEGEYELGTNVHSKEPLAAVTREDDRVFFKFVSWIFESLIQAEESGVTKVTADRLAPTNLFGDRFSNMFRDAVAANGNYGEIYEKNLQDIIPRSGLNTINTGDSGLIYAFPFGGIEDKGPDPTIGGSIQTIKTRGHLNCGILREAGWAVLDPQTGDWTGFGVDMCKGIAAALFNGSPNVNFFPLANSERFSALAEAAVDVVTCATAHTLTSEIREFTTGHSFDFTPPIFFDGLGFAGRPPYATCADRLIFDNSTLSSECPNTLICVPMGTTWLEAMEGQLAIPGANIYVTASMEETYERFNSGECNTIAGESYRVAESTLRNIGYTLDEDYVIGTRKHTKEHMAIVSRSDDVQFSDFLRWVVYGFFYGAEEGITREDPFRMPRTTLLFGDSLTGMWRHSIEAVGNYNEMFARNFAGILEQEGRNNLNNKSGPQFSATPGLVINQVGKLT